MAVERALRQRFGGAGVVAWLLAGACAWALLLWLAALMGMGGRLAEALPVAAGTLPSPAVPKPDRIGPLAQYASAVARPLFTGDRRPRSFLASSPETGQADADASRFDFVLTGVLISPRVRLAILQPTAGGESQRVPVGQAPEGAEGWRLVEVQARRATFEGAAGQTVLDLRTYGAAGSPAVPRAQDGNPEAAAAAADAANAARNAAHPPAQDAPENAARVEEIRRRIEARRAQMQAAQQNSNGVASPP